jgi:hypothetical protein
MKVWAGGLVLADVERHGPQLGKLRQALGLLGVHRLVVLAVVLEGEPGGDQHLDSRLDDAEAMAWTSAFTADTGKLRWFSATTSRS